VRALRPLALLLVLAACDDGAPIAAEDLLVSVTLGVNELEFGRAFPVTVVRVWDKDLEPEEWRDELLAPLSVELEETSRREDARRVEETRRYTGRAFTLDDVIVPPLTVRATALGGGDDRVFTVDGPALHVKPSVDREEPGPPELPSGLLSEPAPWSFILAGGLAALALIVLLIRRARHRATPAPTEPEAPPVPVAHGAIALRRLAALRELSPSSPAEIVAFYVETADVLRAYVAGRSAARLEHTTSEELVALSPVSTTFDDPHVDALAVFLTDCDSVKFGAVRPGPDERDALVAGSDSFVRTTRSEPLEAAE